MHSFKSKQIVISRKYDGSNFPMLYVPICLEPFVQKHTPQSFWPIKYK